MNGPILTDGSNIDRIGRNGNTYEFAGYLTELLVWDTGLSDKEVRIVEEYLLQKYEKEYKEYLLVKKDDVYVVIVKQYACSY